MQAKEDHTSLNMLVCMENYLGIINEEIGG